MIILIRKKEIYGVKEKKFTFLVNFFFPASSIAADDDKGREIVR